MRKIILISLATTSLVTQISFANISKSFLVTAKTNPPNISSNVQGHSGVPPKTNTSEKGSIQPKDLKINQNTNLNKNPKVGLDTNTQKPSSKPLSLGSSGFVPSSDQGKQNVSPLPPSKNDGKAPPPPPSSKNDGKAPPLPLMHEEGPLAPKTDALPGTPAMPSADPSTPSTLLNPGMNTGEETQVPQPPASPIPAIPNSTPEENESMPAASLNYQVVKFYASASPNPVLITPFINQDKPAEESPSTSSSPANMQDVNSASPVIDQNVPAAKTENQTPSLGDNLNSQVSNVVPTDPNLVNAPNTVAAPNATPENINSNTNATNPTPVPKTDALNTSVINTTNATSATPPVAPSNNMPEASIISPVATPVLDKNTQPISNAPTSNPVLEDKSNRSDLPPTDVKPDAQKPILGIRPSNVVFSGKKAPVYLNLTNSTNVPITINGVKASGIEGKGCVAVLNKKLIDSNGKVSTIKLDQLTIDPGKTIDFSEEGLYIMLTRCLRNPKIGSKFNLSLTFDTSNSQDFAIEVIKRPSI